MARSRQVQAKESSSHSYSASDSDSDSDSGNPDTGHSSVCTCAHRLLLKSRSTSIRPPSLKALATTVATATTASPKMQPPAAATSAMLLCPGCLYLFIWALTLALEQVLLLMLAPAATKGTVGQATLCLLSAPGCLARQFQLQVQHQVKTQIRPCFIPYLHAIRRRGTDK